MAGQASRCFTRGEMIQQSGKGQAACGRERLKEVTFTTGEIANLMGFSKQAIWSWNRNGWFLPSGDRTRGQHCRYSLNDAAAALIGAAARDDLGFPLETVRNIMALVQRGSEQELENGEILTVLGDAPGLVRHHWLAPGDEQRAWIDELPPQQILERATLYEMLYGRDEADGSRRSGILETLGHRYATGHRAVRKVLAISAAIREAVDHARRPRNGQALDLEEGARETLGSRRG